MEDGLDAGVLLNLNAQALRAHAGRGARRVGDVDSMDAKLCQQHRAFNFPRAVDAVGRYDLYQGNEFALLYQRPDARSLAQRLGRRFSRDWSGRATFHGARLRIDGAHGRPHGADVVGGGAAAAAHHLCSGGNRLAREAGHIFRRTKIDVAALDGARHTGVGHGSQGQRGGAAHGFNRREHGGRPGGAVDANGLRLPTRSAMQRPAAAMSRRGSCSHRPR